MPETTASVQVAVRVRPLNDRELKHNTLPVVTASSSEKTVTLIKNGATNRQERKTYAFDEVFSEFSTQQDVFDKVRPLVDDVVAGFEGTVFAYGQTGTGKTHTMEGNLVSEEGKGVIPRAVEAIFDQLSNPKYSEYTVSAQYLEIYNEELSDLLLDDSASVPATPRVGSNKGAEAKPAELKVVEEPPKKQGERGRVHVHNLSVHKVGKAEDVLRLIQRAQQRRQTGETKMNKASSRSHCVFTLTVSSTRVTSDGGSMECKGKLHLVDLAGSECAKTAGMDSRGPADPLARAREAERKNINQSLLTLGRVIQTLRQMVDDPKEGHTRIPYRDSKLTRLLQESLGGRSKTVRPRRRFPTVNALLHTPSLRS